MHFILDFQDHIPVLWVMSFATPGGGDADVFDRVCLKG
jgi:hypothetical protein